VFFIDRAFGYFAYYCLFLILVLDFQIAGECDYQYGYIFLANALEAVGVIVALNIVDTAGRSYTQGSFYLCLAAVLLVYGALYQYSEQSQTALAMLFIGKIFAAGAMCVLWIQTAEIYPTEVSLSHLLYATKLAAAPIKFIYTTYHC
jgi:hypothetical protein